MRRLAFTTVPSCMLPPRLTLLKPAPRAPGSDALPIHAIALGRLTIPGELNTLKPIEFTIVSPPLTIWLRFLNVSPTASAAPVDPAFGHSLESHQRAAAPSSVLAQVSLRATHFLPNQLTVSLDSLAGRHPWRPRNSCML